ncbi:MAG: SET domain-containing protein-lysine N-methyltransferase [Gammaproteobacteria bacterium]
MKRAGRARTMWVYSSPVYAALRVERSGITGRGLFAGTTIAARAKIGEFEGEVIPIAEARRRAAGKRIVAIVELEKRAIDASATRRGFRYINHSCEPNTFTRLTQERAEFYALRRIRAGEELTVDYGESHHEGRLRCRCGAKRCRGWI